MPIRPQPVIFEPLLVPKPWGGRRLNTCLGKALPPGELIGESWEAASLPEGESHVRSGPLKGVTLHELVTRWGTGLLGTAPPAAGRFPLLIKFLDARENLSVQVHPKPAPDGAWRPGIKHEAWYVVQADPGAKLYVGLRDGVGPEELRRAVNTPQLEEMLRVWKVAAGDCFYLPSGTLHALGAGLLVAEVQTPSDVTFRAYDWGRVGRALHIDQTLAHTRYDVSEALVRPSPCIVSGVTGRGERMAACPAFNLDRYRSPAGAGGMLLTGHMEVWMVLEGTGRMRGPWDAELVFQPGDTVLIPADCHGGEVILTADTLWLRATAGAERD